MANDNDFQKDLAAAKADADKDFLTELTISEETVNALCVGPCKKEHLDMLVKALRNAKNENEAKAKLIADIGTYGVLVARILRKALIG